MIGQILSRLTLFAFVIFESNAAAVLVEKTITKKLIGQQAG